MGGNAQRWLKMIIAGKTFTQIAAGEAVSKRRVQDVVGLALLAPDVLDAIVTDTHRRVCAKDRPYNAPG